MARTVQGAHTSPIAARSPAPGLAGSSAASARHYGAPSGGSNVDNAPAHPHRTSGNHTHSATSAASSTGGVKARPTFMYAPQPIR